MSLFEVTTMRPRLIVRPQRVLWLAIIAFYAMARSTGAIVIKGRCPKCGAEFELPPRRQAPFKVKCPNGHEVIRIKAILTYIRHKRGRGGKE